MPSGGESDRLDTRAEHRRGRTPRASARCLRAPRGRRTRRTWRGPEQVALRERNRAVGVHRRRAGAGTRARWSTSPACDRRPPPSRPGGGRRSPPGRRCRARAASRSLSLAAGMAPAIAGREQELPAHGLLAGADVQVVGETGTRSPRIPTARDRTRRAARPRMRADRQAVGRRRDCAGVRRRAGPRCRRAARRRPP